MKIVSWNINSIRIRLDAMQRVLEAHNPDVILLQETKVNDIDFPYAVFRAMGYPHILCQGEPSYNGVAIISKIAPSEVFALNFYNEQKRHIAAKFNNIEIHNFYVPAGGDIPDVNVNTKFAHKIAYLDEMNDWFRLNRSNASDIVLAGDLNIAPLEHDVWSSKALRYEVSHTDIERSLMLRNIKEFDWCDSFRHFVDPSQKLYSWWSYRNIDWEKSNRGRRLDHIWVTSSLKERLVSSFIFQDSRGWIKPSDHVPIFITLK